MATARWWWDDPMAAMIAEFRKRQEQARDGERAMAGVYPAVNIYDDGEAYMIRAEVPGMDKDKLDVTTKGGQISIRGARGFDAGPEAAYHRRERGMGHFHRVVTLPDEIDGSKVSASYRNGVLEIVCPRVEQARPRRVAVS